MNVWVVIPAYNEQRGLAGLLDRIKARGLSVLVVDDGSSDNTFQIASARADKVIRNENNFGKGAALNKALKHLFVEGQFDYILTMDADGQHSPDDIDKFLAAADRGDSVVIGNRMDNPAGMPWVRIATNKLLSALISRIIGQTVPDTQCGFRLIKREVLEKIQIQSDKFEIESEILVKAGRLKVPIKSVNIQSIYSRNVKSRINPVTDTLRFWRFLVRLNRKGI